MKRPDQPLPSTFAHADVIDYVMGLNSLAGEPVAKAHEIYRHHRSRALPILKAQGAAIEAELDDGVDRSEHFLKLDEQLASVYRDCLEQLKVLWLTEYATEEQKELTE